jgi:hypothetical protein
MQVRRFVLVAGIAALLAAGFVAFAQAEPGLQSSLTAISGQGAGHVDVSPTAEGQGAVFIVQGEAEIHGALPNTAFEVQRAVDFTPNDGVCTIAPSPPAGWITVATFTTSSAGTGAAHFVRNSPPPGPPGFQFDLVLRVISDDGTQVLQSDCMTVTVK